MVQGCASRLGKLAAWSAGGALLTAIAWAISATYIFIVIAGLDGQLESPWRALWDYYWAFPDSSVRLQLLVSGAAPILVMFLLAFVLYQITTGRRTKRRMSGWRLWLSGYSPSQTGVTDNHGHAAWMKPWEAAKHFPTEPHPERGGKVIGRCPQTGKTHYDHLKQGRTGLTIEFSGSGTGKTSSLISQICRFYGPKVILDPSCEIGPMTWRYLSERERVVIVSPDPKPKNKHGEPEPWAHLVARYNPLDWVDPNEPLATTRIRTFARYFFDEDGEGTRGGDNEYFRKAARTLIAVVLGDLLWRDIPASEKTLPEMRKVISLGADRLEAFLGELQRSSPCPMARAAIGPMLNSLKEAGKQFAGVWDEANQATMWLTDPDLAYMVSGSDFRTMDICQPDPISIIFQLPLDLLQTDPNVGRVLFGSFVSAKIASKTTNWALLLPDEPWTVGRAKWMETAIGAGRKHGIAMHAPWLDIGKLESIWGGKSARSFWLSSARCIMISQVNDPAAARDISDACGKRAVLAYSEGNNRGVQAGTGFGGRVSRGQNVNLHEIGRPLIMAHEVIQDLERDDLLVLGLGKPLMLKRALWWQYPDLARAIERSPYEEAAA